LAEHLLTAVVKLAAFVCVLAPLLAYVTVKLGDAPPQVAEVVAVAVATRLMPLRNVIVIVWLVVGSPVNSAVEVDDVDALFVNVVVVDPVPLFNTIVGVGAVFITLPNVPTTFGPVAFVVAVRVFDPAVTVIVGCVVDVGAALKVPITDAGVELVKNDVVFAPLVTVNAGEVVSAAPAAVPVT
jgi:hypothetical protein